MIARPARPLPAAAWLGLPIATCLLAAVFLATPVRILGLQAPEPVFALVPAFAWALIRPSVWAPAALVVLGLCLDLLWGAPLGLWALCLLAAYGMIFIARGILSGQDFWVLWAWYGAACALAEGLGAVLIGARAGHSPNLLGAGLQWAVSAALFPFAWRLIERYEDADIRFR